jgi:hypothetical protein
MEIIVKRSEEHHILTDAGVTLKLAEVTVDGCH